MKWMLDTHTCLAIIKRKPESALKKVRGKSISQVGISSIILGELSWPPAGGQVGVEDGHEQSVSAPMAGKS
jgi:predicted nucleic acid-binding protein